MRLPSNSIGISDIIDWRECAQRMALGMRRHDTLPDGRKDDPPGHRNWTNAYGSAVHEAINLVETQGLSNDEAIAVVWKEYGGYLDPSERAMLAEDLDAYRGDTPVGMEVVAAEKDVRVPLFIDDDGTQIYFRFKIDALYRRTLDHTVFFQRDYKSSKWRKTQREVDEDLQQWAYNWGVFELYPECSSLIQSYEQLRFGNLLTSKNKQQREQMKAWLIETVKTILADETPEPTQNQWCPYCPLVVSCSETVRATKDWQGRLAMLAPLSKEGRKVKVAFLDEAGDLAEMIEMLPAMTQARKHIEKVEETLKTLIEEMPSEERERLGWRLSDRKTKVLSPEGLRAMHEALGDSFYDVVSMSRAAVETLVGKPKKGDAIPPQLQLLREVELERVSSTSVVRDDG